jgi:hypothetical protein
MAAGAIARWRKSAKPGAAVVVNSCQRATNPARSAIIGPTPPRRKRDPPPSYFERICGCCNADAIAAPAHRQPGARPYHSAFAISHRARVDDPWSKAPHRRHGDARACPDAAQTGLVVPLPRPAPAYPPLSAPTSGGTARRARG